MRLGDTIVALSSPPGRSPRALIRISGPATDRILHTLTGASPPERHATPAIARLTDTLELPILVCRFKSPRSYTGEDSAELHLPGNPYLIERFIARLIATPGDAVRAAEPGEFSARAYLNGKLTLEQAEGIAATIAAQTQDQLDAASRLSSGATGARYRAWADELTTLLALVEAGIDFSDQEDVVPITGANLAKRLAALTDQIRQYLGAAAGAEVTRAAPTVVLAGAPNAGKSTLFNALLGHHRAVVSPTAGTTRDVLCEALDLSRNIPGASEVSLCDLAGLDAPGLGTIQAQAQEMARRAVINADAIIYCDPSGRFVALAGVPADRPIIRVRTKADLPTSAPAPPDSLAVCALDRWNLNALRRAIADAACTPRSAGEAALLPRHRRALASTISAVTDGARLCTSPHRLHEPELIAGALRQAVDAIGELVGNISPDDILGRVFATFCVGK